MPQSLTNIVIHLIFSTKDRHPFLAATIRPSLHAYLATIARDNSCECLRVGGVADHIHIAFTLPRTITVASLVETLKTTSTKWLKSQFPSLAPFAWQRGYSAFSVNPTNLSDLISYIDNQESHHRTQTFQDEYRHLLQQHHIACNESYLWD